MLGTAGNLAPLSVTNSFRPILGNITECEVVAEPGQCVGAVGHTQAIKLREKG